MQIVIECAGKCTGYVAICEISAANFCNCSSDHRCPRCVKGKISNWRSNPEACFRCGSSLNPLSEITPRSSFVRSTNQSMSGNCTYAVQRAWACC